MFKYSNVCSTTLLMLTFMLIIKMNESSYPMALYDIIYRPKQTDSIAISPVNLKSALSVVALAAKGKTQKEILKSIETTASHLLDDILTEESNITRVYRKIYVADKDMIQQHFKTQLSPIYEFQEIDFGQKSAKRLINNEVRIATDKRISAIFPKSLGGSTGMVSVDVLSLKANWKSEFSSVVKRGFNKPMVHQYGEFKYANLTDLNAAVLLMEFENSDAQLLVLQPNDNDLVRLSEQLLNLELTELPKRLETEYMSLFFPIIKRIKTSLSLKDALISMGLERAFREKPNFGNIMDACEEGTGMNLKELRQHTSFETDDSTARFVSVTGVQMDLTNTTRSACSCLPDEYDMAFADADDIDDKLGLTMRRKAAAHHYFDGKLFFALMRKNDILFIGTLAKEK